MTSFNKRIRRRYRVRSLIRKNSKSRARLSVFRSNKHIYAQLIDDISGVTLAQASTFDKVNEGLKSKSNIDAAIIVGKQIAELAKKVKVVKVVFDRGGYLYHGRVRALAEAARKGGLDF